jgi:predicted type IV restriction endonuclease
MDFSSQIKVLAARVPDLKACISTEEATKQYLVIPFIQALGYDVFNPAEVFPELDANVGASKKYKLDYGIFKDGKPIILVECKSLGAKLTNNDDSWSQLFHYFAATDARIGLLTNGTLYRFYADLEQVNKMDKSPFLEIDLENLQEPLFEELKKVTKSAFSIDEMINAATEMKYVGGIQDILRTQMAVPTEEFTAYFFKQLCPGKSFSQSAKQQFSDYSKRAFKMFVRERISEALESGLGEPVLTPTFSNDHVNQIIEGLEVQSTNDGIVTTPEEIEAFYIVKSILREVVDPSRIHYKDVQSYFGILLDNNTRKPICRLYLDSSKNKRLGLFEHGADDKQQEKFPIADINDIFQYAERLKAAVAHYDDKKKMAVASSES